MSPALRSLSLHPLHAILLSFPVALFASAFASDVTYLNSGEVQWSNLSQWAITGALVFGAPVLIWAAVDRIRARGADLRSRPSLYLILIAAMWVLGLIDAFKHSQDAWSSVGAVGVVLSFLCTVLAFVAAWIAHTPYFAGEQA
ncbi:DUF2231 domain-containing protein [Sphingomonas sp. CJ20]